MRTRNWIPVFMAIALWVGAAAEAQVQANRLTIQNGGEYYYTYKDFGFPNEGGCRYFPSFTHIPAVPDGAIYPWKIAGWIWTGMQANVYGPQWVWSTCLQASTDNPHNVNPSGFDMSFDYPQLFAIGAVPSSGFSHPIYGGALPTTVPVVGGRNYFFPSSAGGFDGYLNVFAVGAASWNIPSTAPYYGWEFAFTWPCASAITVPSMTSIWSYVWQMKGRYGQYMILSENEQDGLGGPGNPGRNYSIYSDMDNGCMWYWPNGGTGVYGGEWSMGIFVCDTVSIPVNVPGAPNSANPFLAFGFDVGVPTLMPKNSLNCQMLGVMTEDYTNSTPNSTKPLILLASIDPFPTGPINNKGCRLPHGWGIVTNLFANIAPLFQHTTAASYPGAIFGSTAGGHSQMLPWPADPNLFSVEMFFSTYSLQTKAVSAGYMITLF